MILISRNALNYTRSRMSEVMMGYECVAERITAGSHDETTLVYTPGERTELYSGPCRIWEITGSNVVGLGDADAELDISSTQLSLPWDSPLLKKNDEVEITAADTDDQMVGKRFQVQSSAMAGELRATRRYSVVGIG